MSALMLLAAAATAPHAVILGPEEVDPLDYEAHCQVIDLVGNKTAILANLKFKKDVGHIWVVKSDGNDLPSSDQMTEMMRDYQEGEAARIMPSLASSKSNFSYVTVADDRNRSFIYELQLSPKVVGLRPIKEAFNGTMTVSILGEIPDDLSLLEQGPIALGPCRVETKKAAFE